MTPPARICIATVTCDAFLLGTVVMLDSFFRHNRGFKGDVVVIHDDLGDEAIAVLRDSFPKVKLQTTTAALATRLRTLVADVPSLASKRLQFCALDVMTLTEYDQVLFCDSDLLFRASVEDLFARAEPLLCCGDGPHYRGNARNRETFDEVPISTTDQTGQFHQTFNSGFLLLDRSLLTAQRYDAMLAMITSDRWAQDATGHTDQLVFNNIFAGQQTLLSPAYNYVLLHRRDIYKASGTTLKDAAVVHYNGPAKPWLPVEFINRRPLDPVFVKALEMWNSAYIAYLTRMSLPKSNVQP